MSVVVVVFPATRGPRNKSARKLYYYNTVPPHPAPPPFHHLRHQRRRFIIPRATRNYFVPGCPLVFHPRVHTSVDACVCLRVRSFVCGNSRECFLSTCITHIHTYAFTQKYSHTYNTRTYIIRERNGIRTHVYGIRTVCMCVCVWTRWREDGTSKLKFALFSRGSAIVPACVCYLTPGRRPPPPPVRKTLRLARGLHYSYKSFLVNIFLCSAATPLSRRSIFASFCPSLEGVPRRHRRRTTTTTSRFVSSPRRCLFTSLYHPRHRHTLLQTSHKLSIDPVHHRRHRRRCHRTASSTRALRFLSLGYTTVVVAAMSFHVYSFSLQLYGPLHALSIYGDLSFFH